MASTRQSQSPSPSPSPAASSSSGLGRASSEEPKYDPAPEDIAAYEELMASLLPTTIAPPSSPAACPDDQITTADGATRPMTKAEKLNAKKKRRKERERFMRIATATAAGEVINTEPKEKPVSFRLFSEIRPLYLHKKEDYPLTQCPRVTPLPWDTRARISRLAAEAALPPPEVASAPRRRKLGLRATPCGEVCDFEDVMPMKLVCDNIEVLGLKGKRKVTAYIEGEGVERVGKVGRKRRKEGRVFPPAKLWRPRVDNGYAYGW